MLTTTMFSIGYGNRKPEIFLQLLQQNGIDTLVDIRTKPMSRFQPAYNKGKLHDFLAEHGINYIFMGDTLGGKPKDEKFYVNGKIDYELINTTAFYQEAIKNLVNLSKSNSNVCIMCCELKPDECHRKGLVGETLDKLGVKINHINEKGGVIPHSLSAQIALF